MTPIVVNMNAAVLVTLTEAGMRWDRAWHESFGLEPPDPDGNPKEYTLWELMRIFGPHVYNGCLEIPFVDNRITILDSRL